MKVKPYHLLLVWICCLVICDYYWLTGVRRFSAEKMFIWSPRFGFKPYSKRPINFALFLATPLHARSYINDKSFRSGCCWPFFFAVELDSRNRMWENTVWWTCLSLLNVLPEPGAIQLWYYQAYSVGWWANVIKWWGAKHYAIATQKAGHRVKCKKIAFDKERYWC